MTPSWLLFRRFSLRHWRMAPGQNLLLVMILALGVGVFVAIRLANRAAIESFQHFTETLVGTSDWVIEPPSGQLRETVLSELRAALGDRAVDIVAVVETTAARADASGSTIPFGRETDTLLGVDLVALANLASARAAKTAAGTLPGSHTAGGQHSDYWGRLRAGPRVWVPRALAREASLRLIVNDRLVSLPVAGVVPAAPGGPPAPDNLLVMDLPELQKLTGTEGRIDRVEFIVEAGPRLDERRAELGALLAQLGKDGERWSVRTPGARRETAALMTEAFRLNLTILSLIALLVGLYLIFQALDGAVVRRRLEIAILRALGMDEALIRRAWLIEAAALGAVGGGAGVLLGWLGAQGAVRAVGDTVNALYFATTVRSAGLEPSEVLLGVGLGVAASVAAGWWPAREAAQTPPAQILVRSGGAAPGARLWQNAWLGLAAIAAGIVLSRLPAWRLAGGIRFPLAGYASALAWILGGGILFAATLPWTAFAARALAGRFAAARIAAGHLRHPSGRHRLAAAALLCAVGMSAGMAILVSSFESTVRGWVGRALEADLYLYSAGNRSASSENRISADTWRALSKYPGILDAWILAAFPLQLGDGSPTLLTGTDLEKTETRADFPWIQAPRDRSVFDPAQNRGLALVSESFADRFEKWRGDTLVVPTPAGANTLRIAGVYADYGNERGAIMMQREELAQWMGDDSATHVSLFLKPGVNAGAVRARLQKDFPGLKVFSHADLRTQILRIFRQTFSITYALEVIGVVVSIAGLALAMTSVLLDRREELTTLRALGFQRSEIAVAASIEGFAVAAWAVAGGLLLSIALGWILIHVINKQSFGWTLGFALPWRQLSALAASVAVTGAVISYAVGLWGAHLPADREE